ncbi:homeodomain superfamily [Sporothrix stenoceras]|uniref:Homeodomain superfamily n=1 Tax=Sporothrix stenoceras TaxID=5173 RepID=A0ABR3ZMF6_9PEZI
MTVAVMRGFPTTHSAFESSSPSALRDGGNRLPQHQGLPTSRSTQEPVSLSLPPIREALSFFYAGPPDSTAGSSRATSVPSGPQRLSHSPRTANESLAGSRDNTYVLSNESEREREMRMSFDDAEREREERYGQNQIPRGYSSGMPYHHLDHHGESSGMTEGAATASVGSSPPSSSAYSTIADSEAWSSRRYTDSASHYPGSGRPSLPALPHMMDDHHAHHQQSRPSHASHHSHGSGPGPYQQHPSRAQSLSGGSIGSFDRAIFPPSASSSGAGPSSYDHRHSSRSSSFNRHPQDTYYSSNDYRARGVSSSHGGMMAGVNGRLGDSKQRKRRGNLPKETTDKLRAWFSDHLHHPYPSEDEKQDLMTQTGLQMNQISNWFINARRRHLPAMINNARAVNGAMTGGHSSGSGAMGSAMGGMGGSMDAGRSGASAKGYMPANERMYPSPERMYGSFERPLEPRPSSIYTGSEHHHHRVDPRRNSPSSDDDY